MRRIAVLLYMPLMLILSLPYLLVTYAVRPFSRSLARRMAYGFIRPYAFGLMWLAGAQFIVEGRHHIDESENYLFVANHRSLLDTPALMTLIRKPLSFVSKMEMRRVPILAQWMTLFNCLFLDRKDNRKGLKTILQGIDNLKNGDHLAIFPQGTRSEGDAYLPMKAGSFKLATKSGRPIIPIAIYGTDNVLENNVFNVKVSNVRIHIFPPIDTAHMTKEEIRVLPDHVSRMIEAKYKELEALEA